MIYFWICVILCLILIKAVSKQNKILKNRIHFKLKLLKFNRYTSVPLNLTFNLKLPLKKRKIYDHVLKCIIFHSPITYSNIDTNILKNSGIDVSIPLYLEKYPCKNLFKILYEINKKYNFNLIIFDAQKNLKFYKKYIKHNNKLKVLCENEISKKLKENIYKININYKSNKLKELNLSSGFIFNNFKVREYFKDINLIQNYYNNFFEINIIQNKFISKVIKIELKNITNKLQCISFNYIKDLSLNELNYYLFKKQGRTIVAENLFTQNKLYLYTSHDANVCFSKVLGLKNSNRPCVNLEYDIKLKPKEVKYILIIESCKEIKNKQSEFESNQQKLRKIFNIKIQTENLVLNNLFNNLLPKRITLNGIQDFSHKKLSIDEVLNKYKHGLISDYECYVLLKENFIIENDDKFEIQTSFMTYKLKLFLKNKIKTISASKGERPCLNIDDVIYYNARTLSKTAIDKARGEIKIVF